MGISSARSRFRQRMGPVTGPRKPIIFASCRKYFIADIRHGSMPDEISGWPKIPRYRRKRYGLSPSSPLKIIDA
jgi:hypothetical protein